MAAPEPYTELPGKALVADGRFSYVMALALNPASGDEHGLIRGILSREGDVAVSGYLDRSRLYLVKKSGDGFAIGDPLLMRDEEEIVAALAGGTKEFIGCEDPDIVADPATSMLHAYFTMPFLDRKTGRMEVHLGHAEGASLESLAMTRPVLLEDPDTGASAKEVSLAPRSSSGTYFHLIESSAPGPLGSYSTVRVAEAAGFDGAWRFGKTAFHPGEHGLPWIAGHASPGPLLPASFLDLGPGKLVGLMNGREANREENGQIAYGEFSVGLFVYDYEKGEILWVAPEPLIRDSGARTITFASYFADRGDGQGLLYAHVDDAFVRAYALYSQGIRELLPEEFR